MRAGSIPYEGIKFYSYAKFKEWLPHNPDGSQVMWLACECRVPPPPDLLQGCAWVSRLSFPERGEMANVKRNKGRSRDIALVLMSNQKGREGRGGRGSRA